MFLLLNHGISNIIHSGVTGITSKNVSIQNHLVLELLRIKLVATMKKELQVLHFMHQIGKLIFGLVLGFGLDLFDQFLFRQECCSNGEVQSIGSC